ncbi:MAG: efflux RND transporter periplasmic adaptor subunit [Gammaproteobacteria bacterium]|nr:efflux RND transporter periplasmic adaptor subunit [Gammaproteobacteria bacterium]
MTKNLALATCLVVAACAGPNDEPKARDPVALVALGATERGAIATTLTLYGVAEHGARGRYVLSAPVEASLSRIAAPVGAAVQRGQVIAELTPSPTSQLALAKATAEQRAADEAYARARRLRSDGLIGDAEVETTRAAAAGADATVVSLTRTMAAASLTLRATAPGYVDSLGAGPGVLVPAGTPVATITTHDDLRARFGIDPANARKLDTGARLKISTAYGGTVLTVPILSIDPVVDPQTRLAAVYAALPEGSGIGAGETLTADVAITAASDVVTIPYAALLDDAGQPYVFVVQEGVAHRRDVETGAASTTRIALTKGLEAGAAVVIEGGTALDDGMQVRTR